MSTRRIAIAPLLLLFVTAAAHPQTLQPQDLKAGDGKHWYKGNSHTHTLWSDGDGAPEMVVDWYKQRGYDFLCLSDHNVYLGGDKWFPVMPDSRLTPERLEGLVKQFGKDSIELQTNGARTKMRLKTLAELKTRFEQPEHFLLISAEEVTTRVVHLNAINNQAFLEPLYIEDGAVRKTLAANLDAIEAHGKQHGVPVLAHVNHPNWDSGVTAEDMIAVGGERFFEVYNGHSGVRNWGDASEHKQPTDRLWDIILAMRAKDGLPHPMFGMATDDSHEYYEFGLGMVNSGRGWVQVLADTLTPEAIIAALKRGDFYASSGVIIEEIHADTKGIRVHIAADPGVTYTTQFIGTRKNFNAESKPVLDAAGDPIPWATRIYSDDIGQVLHKTTENPATYTFTGDELYVRAKIVSSKLQDNPFAEGDHETAWIQPVHLK